MNSRDDLLRASVFAAFDVRGTDLSAAACRKLYDGYMLWPAVECELAIERARQRVEEVTAERAAEMVELVALMRSTYPRERCHAA